jgi:hypothetical protein
LPSCETSEPFISDLNPSTNLHNPFIFRIYLNIISNFRLTIRLQVIQEAKELGELENLLEEEDGCCAVYKIVGRKRIWIVR